MKSFFKKPGGIIFIASTLILIGSLFFLLNRQHETLDTATVKIANLKQEVSVVGRVKPALAVNLSFDLSGRIASIPVEIGQQVSRGEVLMQLDVRDASRDVRNAEISLEDAYLSLERIRREETSRLSTRQSAEAELRRLFEEAFGLFNVIYDEVPHRIRNLETAFEKRFSETEGNIDYYNQIVRFYYPMHFRTEKYEPSYLTIRQKINNNFNQYKQISRFSPLPVLEVFLDQAYETINSTADFIRESRDVIVLYRQIITEENLTPNKISVATTETQRDEISDLSLKLDEYTISLFSIRQRIKDQQEKVFGTELDLQAQELSVRGRQNDLEAARDRFADHFLRAPFDGVVTSLHNRNVGELISANVPAVSLISESNFEIEANVPEADIAKIKIKDHATLTLDAYAGSVFFEAEVSDIDPAETIIEGLSTYKVTFQFKSEDLRIKSGMTADLLVLTDKRENVLVIPQRAVFNKDGQSVVKVIRDNGETNEVFIQTGLRGSDGNVEVLRGLNEGDRIVISF